jgi:peptidoglycan hydrolase-like protein with peptidoglycan-binding domain
LPSTVHGRRHARVITFVLTFLLAFGALAGVATAAPVAVDDKQTEKQQEKQQARADVGVQDICNYTTARPTLSIGSSGSAVRQAQCYVYYSVRAADLEIDGQFGPITRDWVIVFQRCAGIAVDGIVGPQTWSHLTYWANSPSFVC